MSGTPDSVCPAATVARLPGVADPAGLERAIGVAHLGQQLLQRDAIERELFGIGLDADLLRVAARDVGQSDIVDLVQLGAQFRGEFVEILLRVALRQRPVSATASPP